MKISHRRPIPNWWRTPESDHVEPEYEAQVQYSTERAEREYHKARLRLERAEARLASAMARREASRKAVRLKQIRELEAVVELRREELAEWQRMMTATGAGAQHRGPRSYRPVPDKSHSTGL